MRAATPADLELLEGWQRQPHLRQALGDGDWRWAAELARRPDWREQLIAEADGRPIGFVQIIDPAREDSHYWGCVSPGHRAIDIWIGEPAFLGRGYGTEMMRQAIARAFADPEVTAVLVDPLECNQPAHRFYERLGFEFVVCRCFDDDYCAVFRLGREAAAADARKTA